MTLEKSAATTSGEWTESHKPIVVAIDGSERNRSAVDWASGEAVDAGAKIVLVTAIDDFVIPIPHFSVRSLDRQARDMLAAVRTEVQHVVTDQEVTTDVVAGSPVDVLLDRSKDSRMVVVGKRGLGGFARVLVGSTSIALAGRAKVPVAIVPDDWRHEDHRSDPVVVGIAPYRAEHRPIHLAFHRARRLGVKLIAVHGWETPTMYDWDSAVVSGALAQWELDAHARFDEVLEGWRQRCPDVEVEAVHSHSHPAMAVLDAAEHAQLVVLGRHTDSKLGGFTFGSVTRAVLHYSECPVMVVPAEGS